MRGPSPCERAHTVAHALAVFNSTSVGRVDCGPLPPNVGYLQAVSPSFLCFYDKLARSSHSIYPVCSVAVSTVTLLGTLR